MSTDEVLESIQQQMAEVMASAQEAASSAVTTESEARAAAAAAAIVASSSSSDFERTGEYQWCSGTLQVVFCTGDPEGFDTVQLATGIRTSVGMGCTYFACLCLFELLECELVCRSAYPSQL